MKDTIQSLIRDYADGVISPDRFDELQRTLREDEGVRERFLHEINLHATLDDLALAESESAAETSVPSRLDQATARPTRRWVAIITASLLLVTSGILAIVLSTQWSPPPPLEAKLTYVSGEVVVYDAGGEPRAAAVGMVLSAGERIETSGPNSFVVLGYEDATEVSLAGESAAALASRHANHLTLKKGTLSASVAAQRTGDPMVIKTPQARLDVLGTKFVLAVAAEHTDLRVTQGRVRLTRVSDGESVVVGQGKRAVANEVPGLAVEETCPPPETWSEAFENGVPKNWQSGRFVTDRLPAGSKGAVGPVSSGDADSIVAPAEWMDGLFVVHSDSHLEMTFKMEKPNWINIFFLTRTDDPRNPETFLHKFDALPFRAAEPNVWWTVTIPLTRFQRKTDQGFGDVPPVPCELAVGISWSSVGPDRGLVIDRVRVSRGGPGKLEMRRAEVADR